MAAAAGFLMPLGSFSVQVLPSPTSSGSGFARQQQKQAAWTGSTSSRKAFTSEGGVAVAGLLAVLAAAITVGRRIRRVSRHAASPAAAPEAKTPSSIAKETLARLRARAPPKAPSGGAATKSNLMMPARPDSTYIDENRDRIYPWPKSFAEIVQTAAESTIACFLEGETRIEIDFQPLPLADLEWNEVDVGQTRILDAAVQHCISFSKLLIKDPRPYPKMNPDAALKAASAGVAPETAVEIDALLQKRFKRNEVDFRTVRVVFGDKVDMLRSRDIHFDKWRKMDRPELLRRGYYNEVNEDNWPGPFEDVFVYTALNEIQDLPRIRKYMEKADAVALRQGRVLRHVLFCLNMQKQRLDVNWYRTVNPSKPGLPTFRIHFDWACTFRPAYHIRFGKHTQTLFRAPYQFDYQGALYRAYPGPWQIFMQDTVTGAYRVIDTMKTRPTIACFQRRLQRAHMIWRDVSLPEDASLDLYTPDMENNLQAAGSLRQGFVQALREGFGDNLWFEGYSEECSGKWRL